MKIRIFVDSKNLYDSVVIDTESLSVSYVTSTGHFSILPSGICSTFGDPMPTLFIDELIHNLISEN